MTNDVWSEDWEKRMESRLHSLGCRSIADYMGMFSDEPYSVLAKRLGDDVAPMQLMSLQYREAAAQGQPIVAAKDSLVRILLDLNKRGWNVGLHWKRRRVDVHVEWLNTPPMHDDLKFEKQKEKVWQALLQSNPPDGWIPTSIQDPILKAAFEKGWPHNGSEMKGRTTD